MAEYRVFTADILTGNPVMELPQYGMTMDKQVSGAGSYSGFFRLGTGVHRDDTIMQGCTPGQHCIMVQRDGVNIWGGPIWGRTYAAEGSTIQINANTFESVFERIIMSFDVIYQGVGQNAIIADWLTDFLTQDASANDFGFIPQIQTPVAAIPNRTILIPAYEYHPASDFLSEIVGVEGGLDYSIDFTTSGDNPVRTIRFMYLNESPDSGAYFDFPGTVAKYWMNENGSKLAYKRVALGAGSGNQLMKSVNTSVPPTLAPWGAVESYPNIGTQVDLNLKSASMARKRTPPIYEPTVELAGDHVFTGWNDLGRLIRFRIEDDRFPTGQEFAYTLTGWSLTPSTKEGTEQVQFTLADYS
jgi:hypothetical protein